MRTTSRRPRPDQALTLVEVVMALAVLTVIMAGLGSATTTSIRATREGNALHLARQAAQTALDDLRAVSNPIRGAGGAVETYLALPKIGAGAAAYADLDASAVTAAYATVLAGPVASGAIFRPAAGAMIRYRIMAEDEYGATWGTAIDLDRDGNTTDTAPVTVNYVALPVVIEVHFRDQTGTPGMVRLTCLFNDEPAIDSTREN